MTEIDYKNASPRPWTYYNSPSADGYGNHDWIEDAAGSTILENLGCIDGPLICAVVNAREDNTPTEIGNAFILDKDHTKACPACNADIAFIHKSKEHNSTSWAYACNGVVCNTEGELRATVSCDELTTYCHSRNAEQAND